MNNKIIAAVVLGCTIMLSNCQKEEADSLPEGAIQLTTEGFHGNEKTSVSGNTVQWDGSSTETVNINGDDYEVHVSGNHAYINPGGAISAPVRGYYACGSVSTPNGEKPNEVVVEIPDHYDCCMNGDRQVIALPMVAYSSSSNEVVEFKHLTAAVNVLVWNATENDLCVDRVVITVAGHRLHGNLSLNLANENYDIAASYDDPSSAADSTVSVSFPSSGEGSLVVSPGESNAKSIQVPILPVGNDQEMTIQIYTHVNEASWHKYIFNHHASISNALTRNKMVMARCKIHTGDGNHVYENTFSVNNSQKVFFSPGNLQYIGSASSPYWKFAEHQYDVIFTTSNQESGAANIDRDLFGWGTWDSPNKITKYNYQYSWSQDWGHNPISNGGNTADQWHTLRGNAWDTVLIRRATSTSNLPNSIDNIRYTMATINGTHKGVILFPDNYSHPKGTGFMAGTYNNYSNYTSTVTIGGWALMEIAGAIFLPTTGYRSVDSQNIFSVNREYNGFYWSCTSNDENSAFTLTFSSNSFASMASTPRYQGLAVRLVRNAD